MNAIDENLLQIPTKHQVRGMREMLGLSRSSFGAITYVTERAVVAWEKGEHQMGKLYWEKYLLHFSKLKK